MGIFYRNKERGFTLIEVMVTISIIGILAAIGIIQFRTAVAQRELNHAALELISDIRWMQQLSANDDDFLPLTSTSPIDYLHQLTLWDVNQPQVTGVKPNCYQVLNLVDNTVLKEIKFSDDKVNALLMNPAGSTSVGITYYASDLDRIKSDGILENSPYQIKLTHTVTQAIIYINVDSRVGRVWTNTDGASPL